MSVGLPHYLGWTISAQLAKSYRGNLNLINSQEYMELGSLVAKLGSVLICNRIAYFGMLRRCECGCMLE